MYLTISCYICDAGHDIYIKEIYISKWLQNSILDFALLGSIHLLLYKSYFVTWMKI